MNQIEAFISGLSDEPKPPCEMGCPHLNQCSAAHISCAAFHEYVHGNSTEPIRWMGDAPSRKQYNITHPRKDMPIKGMAA